MWVPGPFADGRLAAIGVSRLMHRGDARRKRKSEGQTGHARQGLGVIPDSEMFPEKGAEWPTGDVDNGDTDEALCGNTVMQEGGILTWR